jgi:hypothetical protein
MKSAEFLALINGDGRAFVAENNNINNGYPVLRIQNVDNSSLVDITKEAHPQFSYVEGQTFDTSTLSLWSSYSDGTRVQVTGYGRSAKN